MYGLSPRGRGNLPYFWILLVLPRSIPAWAGKPPGTNGGPAPVRVYPRVGGETACCKFGCCDRHGLSPRGRGNRRTSRRRTCWMGSIPAWAGKPADRPALGQHAEVYPRVGGETEYAPPSIVVYTGLSPRGRGNLDVPGQWRIASGSIPAWAGKPPRPAADVPYRAVYPRVGGETEWSPLTCRPQTGLSPRGRGNRLPPCGLAHALGSIPAWAGKPPA